MVKIVADSTCDLSRELVEKYDIAILPLHILLGDEEYEDGIGITPEEIFRWSDRTKTTPKTSAPSLERTVDLLRPFAEAGQEIICFSISDSMSTTGNVMRLAAEELEALHQITVIDSANLSTGVGLLVIEAAAMAQKGKCAAEITAFIASLKDQVRASFVVDTLTYLHRGGRCSGLAALAGGALHLHPKIAVKDGKMGAGKKYRGKLERVIMDYVRDLEPEMKTARRDRVFITHSGCDPRIVERVHAYLEELQIFDEVLETRAGGVISSHCGPNTLGVLYVSDFGGGR